MIKIPDIPSGGKMKWPEIPFKETHNEPSYEDFGVEEAYNHDSGIVVEKNDLCCLPSIVNVQRKYRYSDH